MKKILLLNLLLLFSLSAKTVTADYKVEFGIIGKIGIAKALLTQNDSSYVIM